MFGNIIAIRRHLEMETLPCFSSTLVLAFLLVGLCSSNSICHAQTVSTSTREIVVTSEATARSAPKSVQVTALVQSSAATGKEAAATLEQKVSGLLTELEKLGAKIEIATRGEAVSNAAQARAAITPGTAIQAQRHVGITTEELEKTGEIIDLALSAGASSITEVSFSTPSDTEAHLSAVYQAVKKAKRKADIVAKSLNLSLGDALSITVSEEPVGLMLRKKMQQGLNVSDYSEKEANIYVSIRFSVKEE